MKHGLRRRGIALLRPGDEIEKHVSGFLPVARRFQPLLQRGLWISGRLVGLRELQARVSEVGGRFDDERVLLGFNCHNGDIAFTGERHERGVGEALVANLDGMAQSQFAERRRQQIEISAHLRGVVPLVRRHLPEDRAELRTELADAAVEEPLDRLRRFAQIFPLRGRARRFHREHELVRRRGRPLFERSRALRAIEGGVDLNRSNLPAGVVQLLRRGDVFGVEGLSPGLIRPAPELYSSLFK